MTWSHSALACFAGQPRLMRKRRKYHEYRQAVPPVPVANPRGRSRAMRQPDPPLASSVDPGIVSGHAQLGGDHSDRNQLVAVAGQLLR